MTHRNYGVIPHPTRAENAARISTAYLPIEDDDPLSAARGIINGLILSLLIFGVPLLVWFAL